MTNFFRFPHTPYLEWASEHSPRGDKVLSAIEAYDLLNANVIVEEKIDGANLGISLTDDGNFQFQNRGHILTLPGKGQFSRLSSWLNHHRQGLAAVLKPELILFGEWCAARHSLDYSALPDWFIMFDVYDSNAGKFWSISRRNSLARHAGLITPYEFFRGRTTMLELKHLLNASLSHYRNGPPEGIVIRRENTEWSENRAKLVRSDFTQSIEKHWRKRILEWNMLSHNKK
ncbi:RNA ligase family protein [Enterobacter sp. K16B]|uniref:RNA ligase family protein n=1 Tax=Enterobacter sp. K16B TaxID=2878537 RepID=UPI001CD93B7C|nr:RNA ligase family protein [Enterobacter sp. K16B]MCA2028567.1 RNA ligase family protein [Enterobacter sp. K16B]